LSHEQPFEILDQWVREGRIRLAAPIVAPAETAVLDPIDDAEVRDLAVVDLPADLSDQALFEFAMRDVRALGWSAVPLADRPPIELTAHDDEAEALRELEDFMRHGNMGMEQSPEYMSDQSSRTESLYLKDLRSGTFFVTGAP